MAATRPDEREMHMNATYLRNAWYQAGWSDELIEGKTLSRVLLDVPLMLFRDENGSAVALLDRCPHRFAPLSLGRIENGVVRCGYHGLAFDAHGRCVHNPNGPIPPRARVPVFPVLERHAALWVWFGDPVRADTRALPDFAFIDQTPATARFFGHMPTAAHYQLITDNLLDLSHVEFLHSGSFGPILRGATPLVKETGETVAARWAARDVEPPPTSPYRAFVPEGKADVWAGVEWSAPATLVINSGAVPAGKTPGPADQIFALHSLTPETGERTHYFYCVTRRFNVDDSQYTAMMKAAVEQAFIGEDKPMIEAQQARMGTTDLFGLQPLLLSVDGAAVRARRILERLLKAQAPAA